MKEMKTRRQIGTTEGIFVSVLIIIIISFIFPPYGFYEEIRSILTVSTFLFGIFAGFVIASRLSRYSRYRELLTNETGHLIAWYNYSKFVEEKFSTKIREAIDKYLVESFLYEVYEYHEKTEKEFYAIFDEVRKTEAKNQREESTLNLMRGLLRDMLKDREELYLLGKDKLTFWLKTTLIILAGVIFYCLFLVRTANIYSTILTILLAASIVIVLFLIRDLDRLKLYDKAISYGIYHRVFDAIDKPRVYTNETLKRGVKPLKNQPYRYATIVRDKKEIPAYKEIVLVNAKPKNSIRS